MSQRAPKGLRELTTFATDLGFTWDLTGNGRIRFARPSTQPVFASSTPNCCHALQNAKRDLRSAVREAEEAAHAPKRKP